MAYVLPQRPASPTWNRAPCGGQNSYADRSEQAKFRPCASRSQRQIVTQRKFSGVLLWKNRGGKLSGPGIGAPRCGRINSDSPLREFWCTASSAELSSELARHHPNRKAALSVSPVRLSSRSSPLAVHRVSPCRLCPAHNSSSS